MSGHRKWQRKPTLHETILAANLPDPYPERRSPDYCWRNWPPKHDDKCGCASRRAKLKLENLKTAREIHKENLKDWRYRLAYYRGWVPNQLQIWWIELMAWYTGGGPRDDGGVW